MAVPDEARGLSVCSKCHKRLMYGKHLRDEKCELPPAWLAVERKLREQVTPRRAADPDVWL